MQLLDCIGATFICSVVYLCLDAYPKSGMFANWIRNGPKRSQLRLIDTSTNLVLFFWKNRLRLIFVVLFFGSTCLFTEFKKCIVYAKNDQQVNCRLVFCPMQIHMRFPFWNRVVILLCKYFSVIFNLFYTKSLSKIINCKQAIVRHVTPKGTLKPDTSTSHERPSDD